MGIKKGFVFLLVMVLILSGFPTTAGASNQGVEIQSYHQVQALAADLKVDDEIVIIYQNQGSVNDLKLTSKQVEAGQQLSEHVDIIKLTDSGKVDSVIAELSKNPNVLAAEKNRTIQTFALPNDADLDKEWQFERIGADKTWDQIDNEETIVVAVIDTGFNTNHPDLIGTTVAGYDYIDDSLEVKDIGGHGTAVSGCIAAIANNEIGIAGVAGNATIKIAPYRVGGFFENDPSLNLGYICAALYDAANRPEVRVINMSFGGYGASPAMRAAIAYTADMGKILVAAAGNEGSHPEYAGEFAVPASYNNVIAVAATDIDNERASFSQHNPMVDLSAPGKNVYTTLTSGDYASVSGTSFASPITAGACAVLLAADPTLTAPEVEMLLKETALDFGEKGRDDYYGYGMIQVDKALARVKPITAQVSVNYRTHVQNEGWQGLVKGDAISGTYGQSLRLEAIEINTDSPVYDLGVSYKTHVENIGWQDFVADGAVSGTSGQSLRLEAIKIELTGADKELFDIYYQVHAQNQGWLGWTKNGQPSGTEGFAYRLEGIKIQVVPKDSPAPGATNKPYIKN